MDKNNINSAIKLAILFSEEIDIPTRLKENEKKKEKKKNSNPLKNKENSRIEQRFQDKIKSWEEFINTMLSKIDGEKVSRFINLNPTVEQGTISAAYCKDFLDFTNYFILRRDNENCNDEELAQLAQLHTAFQREINKKIT